MATHELTKTIEARKVNRRSGLPTNEPPVSIPYGALLDEVEEDRDLIRFTYLTQRYQAQESVIRPALKALTAAAPPSGVAPPAGAGAQPRNEAGVAAGVAAGPVQLRWEALSSDRGEVARAKVPAGWLVTMRDRGGLALAFYPDSSHAWDGKSLD